MAFRFKGKEIGLRDFASVPIFLFMIIPSLVKRVILKLKHEELWLISENGNARDNGYIFFEYMRKEHPEVSSYFAISSSSGDYEKVKSLGNLIEYGSPKHFLYYMCAAWNIVSHKDGNPRHALFSVLQKCGLYGHVVFLQHGVLYQDFEMFHKSRCCFKMFVCGAKGEYEFVKRTFGYTHEVKYTGLARFDKLQEDITNPDIILYIPTWRRWLTNRESFAESEYFKRNMAFLNSSELEELLERYQKRLLFYPHAETRKFADLYETCNPRVEILDFGKTDIQLLLRKGALLITDYSSIFTDFSYMHKPIVYYQYDKEAFLTQHYQRNAVENKYFDYAVDGFGPVVTELTGLLSCVEEALQKGLVVDSTYLDRIDRFFELHDGSNCERIYEATKTL